MDPALPTNPPSSAPPPPASGPKPQLSPLGNPGAGIFKKIIITFLIIVVLLVITVGSTLALTVYTNVKLPLLSEHKKDLTLVFYKIPLIPKNPEQILITAVDKNTRLKTYAPDFSLTAQVKSTDVEIGSIDLQVNGPVDITDEKNIIFSIDGKAAVNFGGQSYEIDGKILKKDKAIYGKIDKLPDNLIKMYSGMGYSTNYIAQTPEQEIKSNLEDLFKNWIKYEFKNLPTKAREELEKNIESTSITNSIREEAQNFLLKSSILPEVKKLKDEKIEGVDTYHLLLNPNREKTKQIILEYVKDHKNLQKAEYKKATDAMAGSFEQLHLEVWVGKNDAIVRKTSIQTQLDLGFIGEMMNPTGVGTSPTTYNPASSLGLGDLGKAKLAFSTVLVLKDVNKPVVIKLPDKTVTVEEYMKLFSDAFLTKAARQQRDTQQTQSSDMTRLSQALSMYLVDNSHYPATLTDLSGKYITPNDPITARLNTYKYRTNPASNKFVVYVLTTGKYDSSYSTPYYGFTHTYAYPHQLTNQEFTDVMQ